MELDAKTPEWLRERKVSRAVAPGKSRVLFLDRDGCINVDCGPTYLNHPDDAVLIPGVGRALTRAKKAGYKIAVITNQAGVAKGITPRDALTQIHAKLERLIAEEGGMDSFKFDAIEVCTHHPKDACACRKPETALLDRAIADLNADTACSYFVGDKISDLQCGSRRGVRSYLVRTGHGVTSELELESAGAIEGFCGVENDLEHVIARILLEVA